MSETGEGRALESTTNVPSRPRFWILAVLVIAVLLAGYWLVLRTVYVPVLVGLDPQDTADVAKVLDTKKIGYRIQDQGKTIAVAESEADRARVELAGSELPMKGQIGFELFNQADMGLTEFAQKINYQRALQGELARTILLFDGIQTVRVHLGLPERSMFRGEQLAPKASVTLVLKPGKNLSAATVEGIQRLVAGAIPDLGVQGVAVLDGTGRIVSQELISSPTAPNTSDAVIEDARNRVKAAIAAAHPDLRFGLTLSLHYRSEPSPTATPGEPQPSQPVQAKPLPHGVPDFVYSLRVTTEQPLDQIRQADIRRIAGDALKLDAPRGDALVFLTGPIPPDATVAPVVPADEAVVARAPVPADKPAGLALDWVWIGALLIVLAGAGAGFWHMRRQARQRRRAGLADFAQVLRQRLEAEGGAVA